jgi:hypothetical protein
MSEHPNFKGKLARHLSRKTTKQPHGDPEPRVPAAPSPEIQSTYELSPFDRILNNLTITPVILGIEDPHIDEGMAAMDSDQAILFELNGGLKEQENAVRPAKSDILR